MALTPAGPISLNMNAVREMFANADAWKAWTLASGAADPVLAARHRVHFYGPPAAAMPGEGYTRDELESLRPLTILTLRPPEHLRSGRAFFRTQRAGTGARNDSFTLFANVVADVPDSMKQNPPAAFFWFQNQIGTLISDLWAVSHSNIDGIPYLQAIDLISEPSRSTKILGGAQGDFLECLYQIDSGVERGF